MQFAILPLYLLVVLTALIAWQTAQRHGRSRSHSAHWIIVAIGFAGLMLIRIGELEVAARRWLRGSLESGGLYAERWEFQAPLAGIAICASAALTVYAVRAWPGPHSRSALLVWISRLALLGFVPLFGLRLVSLHTTDQLLYAGPVRLNWVIDGGLTLASLAAAGLYVANLRRRGRDPQGRRVGREPFDRH